MPPSRRRRDADAEDGNGEQPQNRRRASGKGARQHDTEDESDEDAGAGGPSQGRNTSGESALAAKLVRYALACEYSRSPIRREAIREKVYAGESMRSFRTVFDLAQRQLRIIFGMQLVEQPTRDRSLMSLDQKRKAAKSQKSQAGPTLKGSTNTWILTTILPPEYRVPDIIAPSKVQSSEGEAAYAGFYTTLITVITLSGGEISDAVFRKYLDRLNAEKTVPSMNPNNQNQPSEQTEVVLQRLVRQGYLVRATAGGEDGGEESVAWHVGPRGRVEVDAEAVAGVVRTVYGDAGGEALERKLATSLGVNPRIPERQDDGGNEDAEGEEEEEEQEQVEEQPRPNKRGRVNTAGQATPVTIRTRKGDGDPGPSRRSARRG